MDTRNTILIILAVLQGSESVALTRLTQETPCLSGQSCRLKCSVVAGVNDKGLHFYRNSTVVVACLQGRDSCQSSFPGLFHLTQEDYNTSYVDIATFDPSYDAATWSCSDGSNGPRNILPVVHNVGVTRLTQETPCLSGQSCRLKCSVVAGVNDKGLHFYRNSTVVVACLQGRDSCQSSFPGLFNLTQEDYNTSYVDIVTFDPSYDADTWSCSDGSNGTRSYLPVVHNVLPTGSLTWGSTCVSGRVTSPASLSCSGLSPGTPPANLTVTDSSNQTVASSQTGSVTWTVTRGGQASCSVTWSAFPSFPLNITTTQCDVQVVINVAISVRNTTGQDKVVTCQAEGHPDTYTFQPWLQSWGGQEVRTVTGSQQGGQYNLTLTSYQDTGTYTCTVDNGVLDTSGQVIQRHMSIMITVDGPPILPLPIDPPIVSGKDGEPVHLDRSVYASPDLVNHTWFFNSADVTSLIPGTRTSRNRDLVLLSVHGTRVITAGTVASLILTASQQYSGLYRLQACNTIGCVSSTVTLVIAKPSAAVPVGAIVGGVLGAIVFALIIVGIVLWCRQRKSQGEDRQFLMGADDQRRPVYNINGRESSHSGHFSQEDRGSSTRPSNSREQQEQQQQQEEEQQQQERQQQQQQQQRRRRRKQQQQRRKQEQQQQEQEEQEQQQEEEEGREPQMEQQQQQEENEPQEELEEEKEEENGIGDDDEEKEKAKRGLGLPGGARPVDTPVTLKELRDDVVKKFWPAPMSAKIEAATRLHVAGADTMLENELKYAVMFRIAKMNEGSDKDLLTNVQELLEQHHVNP